MLNRKIIRIFANMEEIENKTRQLLKRFGGDSGNASICANEALKEAQRWEGTYMGHKRIMFWKALIKGLGN